MPLYDYRCRKCDNVFEALVMGTEEVLCPTCGGRALDRLMGMTAAPPTYKKTIGAARAQAQREGHMSNYSRGTQRRLRSGKSE